MVRSRVESELDMAGQEEVENEGLVPCTVTLISQVIALLSHKAGRFALVSGG